MKTNNSQYDFGRKLKWNPAYIQAPGSGPQDGSGEFYKDYKVPQAKFDSILEPIETINGDTYYNVPLKNNSLAKAVSWPMPKSIKKPAQYVPLFSAD